MKFHKYLLAFLLLSIIFSVGVGNSAIQSESTLPTLISTFENGKLYLLGKGEGHFNILVLKGSWLEMGRQYGHLLKEQINDFYQTASGKLRMGYDQRKTVSEWVFNNLNKNMKEYFTGMAETSGLSLEKHKITCWLANFIILEQENLACCSSMSAWGQYTGGRSLVIGRNVDYGPSLSFKKFVTVVVYNPTGSQNSVADTHFVGTLPCLAVLTSLNSSGLYMDIHSGRLSDLTRVKGKGLLWYNTLLESLFSSISINELEKRLLDHGNLPDLGGLILNVADINEFRVFELAPYDAKSRKGTGLMVSTNHFVDSGWTGLPDVPFGLKGDYSKERLANLLKLGEHYKGRIDAKRMMEIFDKNFFWGGVTYPLYTIFQVVTVPNEKIMWIKAPKFSQWDEIDLKPFFNLN